MYWRQGHKVSAFLRFHRQLTFLQLNVWNDFTPWVELLGDSFVYSQLFLNTLRPAGRRGPCIYNMIMLRYMYLGLNSEQPVGLGRDGTFESMVLLCMSPSEFFWGRGKRTVTDNVVCFTYILIALFQGRSSSLLLSRN